MSDTRAVRYEQEIPDILSVMASVHDVMAEHGLEPSLHHLVQLRASQINRCGFCIKMHLKEARDDGETEGRLDRVIVWDQVNDFSEREKAALAWTEALTELDPHVDRASLRARLRQHFTENEIGVLTAAIAMINMWNRINGSKH